MSHHSIINNSLSIKHFLWIVLVGLLSYTASVSGNDLEKSIYAKLSIAPCPEDATVVKFDYLGACGLTKTSNFTLNTAADVSRIRIWYNTNIGANPLSVNITGPNGFTWSGASTKGGCDTFQKNWCEGIVQLDQRLSAGTYTVDIGSTSMCANPSGQTTLFVYGCEAILISPFDFRYSLTGNQLTLQWDASLGADGYQLFWGSSSGNYPSSAYLNNVTQFGPFDISGLPKTTYYLAVEAYTNSGNSLPSNELVIDLKNPAALSPPQKISYNLVGDIFTLNWDSVSNSTGYKLHLGNQAGQYNSVFELGNNLKLGPLDVSGLPRGSYYLAVTAYDAQQESLPSSELMVTLASGGTTGNEVDKYIKAVMTISNDLLSGGITEQLQPILTAVFGKPTSSCPTVKMNVDVSKITSIDDLLQNLPKPTIVNIDYGTGCTADNGDKLSGTAELKLDNLAIDSAASSLTASLNISSTNLTKNGKLISDGSVAGTLNANLKTSTGDGHFELTSYLVPTGERLTGKADLTILDKVDTRIDMDIVSSDDIHAKLSLLASKISDTSYSISTISPGTVNQYTLVVNSVKYDTDVCKAYPIAGTTAFSANGITQTATFDNKCDGTYTLK